MNELFKEIETIVLENIVAANLVHRDLTLPMKIMKLTRKLKKLKQQLAIIKTKRTLINDHL